ncbi:hypothetical protein ACER0C_001411 [Sarotherodon galilaeus]
MDPADSGVATEEGSLAHLCGYCWGIIQAVDPHRRHIQVVFFDTSLPSTTFSLRASSSFELFGLGSPGKEASLGALAACFFLHRRTVSPPPLAAHLLDPPLQGRRLPLHQHPTPSPLTPSMSAESADKGPTVVVTTVSKPDSVILINPVTNEQEGTVSFNAAPPSRKRRRLRHLRQTKSHLTPVASKEPADSGLAAQGAAVSEIDSVVGKDVFVMKIETALSKPRDSAQSVNNKTGPAVENKVLTTISGAGCGALVSEPVSSETVNSEGTGVAVKWTISETEAINYKSLDCANMNLETVLVAADLFKDPVLEHFSATTGNREAVILHRAFPEAELVTGATSGPLEPVAVAQPAAQPIAKRSVVNTTPSFHLPISTASLPNLPQVAATPSSPPPPAAATPSSPSAQPSAVVAQPDEPVEELSKLEGLTPPEQELSEPEELSVSEGPVLSE